MSNEDFDFEDDTDAVDISQPDPALAEELELIQDDEHAVEVEEPTPAPTPIEVVEQPAPTPPVYIHAAVSEDDSADRIVLASCIYKNTYNQKSLTVHHVQRRLNELGYHEAYADNDGYYGDLTKNAVADFQKAKGIEGEGLMDEETFAALFAGDRKVIID